MIIIIFYFKIKKDIKNKINNQPYAILATNDPAAICDSPESAFV